MPPLNTVTAYKHKDTPLYLSRFIGFRWVYSWHVTSASASLVSVALSQKGDTTIRCCFQFLCVWKAFRVAITISVENPALGCTGAHWLCRLAHTRSVPPPTNDSMLNGRRSIDLPLSFFRFNWQLRSRVFSFVLDDPPKPETCFERIWIFFGRSSIAQLESESVKTRADR